MTTGLPHCSIWATASLVSVVLPVPAAPRISTGDLGRQEVMTGETTRLEAGPDSACLFLNRISCGSASGLHDLLPATAKDSHLRSLGQYAFSGHPGSCPTLPARFDHASSDFRPEFSSASPCRSPRLKCQCLQPPFRRQHWTVQIHGGRRNCAWVSILSGWRMAYFSCSTMLIAAASTFAELAFPVA